MFGRTPILLLLATLALAACQTVAQPGRHRTPRQDRPARRDRPPRQNRPRSSPSGDPVIVTGAIPLTDLVREDDVADTYLGFAGGLYFASNEVPAEHAAFGAETARQIQPLDASGAPSQNGAIGLMSISMSNATQEWCHVRSTGAPNDAPCYPHTFMGQAADDPSLSGNLVIINGARGGQALDRWDEPSDAEYTRIATEVLPAFGLTEAQVQIVWVKVALKDEPSRPSLPDLQADAFVTEATIGNVVRALRVRYPNLQQVFFTSRIYGGWAEPDRNSPEPWAYETGFGTKWAIEAQITQRATGVVDEEAGDLDGMPFMAWGPYVWSYGDRPREDGLMWPNDLFTGGGIHPNEDGARIVANYLLDFFKTAPFTRCWFLDGLTCS